MITGLENIVEWNKEEFLNFIENLKLHQDKEYQEFYTKLIKTEVNVIGVRDPILKKIAKDIVKGDWKGFLQQLEHKYYEENILHGLIIGSAKINKEDYFTYLDEFLKYVDNWAVCDITVATFKFIKKNREMFFDYVEKLCFHPNNWMKRVGLVMLLKFYLDEGYIDRIKEVCSKVDSEDYYVEMALAWLVSEMYIKYEDEVFIMFDDEILSSKVQNKAIQKIKDSLRVTTEQKILINMFKRI